jgi:hypothetical protein
VVLFILVSFRIEGSSPVFTSHSHGSVLFGTFCSYVVEAEREPDVRSDSRR